MKNKRTLFISILAITLLFIGFSSFLTLSIKNATSCDEFVIDNYEMISGIDIPKQTHSQCFYHEKKRLRIGMYSISSPDEFIEAHGLQKLATDRDMPLWSQDFLRNKKVPLPEPSQSLFQVQGESEGNVWQCMVEKPSGNMWFEVKWKE